MTEGRGGGGNDKREHAGDEHGRRRAARPRRTRPQKRRSAERSDEKAEEAAKHIDTSDMGCLVALCDNEPCGGRGRAERARV